jgi:hypothetical protein
MSAVRFSVGVTIFFALIFAASASDPLDVSMVQLLASPAKFHNKLIQVEGYLHVQFEDERLYLSKEDADFLNGKHSLWISYSDQLSKRPNRPLDYFDCKRVLVIGVFDKNQTGHMGAAAGGIRKVSDLMEETRWFDGKKRLTK